MAGINFGQVLGGLGAVSGILGSMNAQRDANRARNQMTAASNAAAEKERAAAAALLKLYEDRMATVEAARKSGVYDAEQLVGRLDRDFARNEARNLQNLAGAFSVLGYRPGDSEPGTRLQAAQQAGLNQRNRMAEELRQRAPMEYINALTAAEGGLLGRAASLEGAAANRLAGLNASLYNDANSRAGDISGLVGTIMPFLNESGRKPNTPATATTTPSTVGTPPLVGYGAPPPAGQDWFGGTAFDRLARNVLNYK